MNSLWNSLKAAFAMYSRIPVPEVDWTEENIKYMFCFFPLIGAVIGALLWLAGALGRRLEFQPSFVAAMLTVLPVLVTGGIHVDGLLDTADAMSSWREREKRLEILKDPHAGAFAVIAAGVYFLTCYGAYSQIWEDAGAMLLAGMGFMVSRSLSGISVMTFPKARKDGTVAEFSRKSRESLVRGILFGYLAVLLLLMLLIRPALGAGAFASALLVFGGYHHMAMKYFGGITGDLAGFFLCTCEAVMTLTLAVLTRVA